jgi:DNA-binding SARP family transcriptional activator
MEWRRAGSVVDLGALKQRTVLATLLLQAGRPVSLDTLIDNVWDEHPPVEARNVVYAHIARIRQLFARVGDAAQLRRRAGGYVLEVDAERVDLHRFRRLVEEARVAAGDADRARLLRAALDLWRGPPLADLSGGWAGRVREVWTQRHIDAVAAWARAELRLGNGTALVGPLTELFGDNPLAESVAEMLMRALYASGRSADALACYTRIRRHLAEALGIDPAPELRRLQQRILRDEPDAPPPAGPVPAQLPLEAPGFTGRAAELADLDAALAAGAGPGAAVAVCVLSGPPGVGKTALALHWAHRVAARFPGGQLHVDLRGFAPSRPAVRTADALDGFLHALGVAQPPPGVAAKAALYRSLLSGRRILVVLDGARDAEQVRPLLPGSPGCLALVSSRDPLAGLLTAEGARWIAVGLPPVADARRILAGRLDPRQVAEEPHALEELVACCDRLPLALAIVAARAATRPGFPLAALVDQVRDADGGLDPFTGPDATTDLRAVFSSSYRLLGHPAARLFRLLGQHPGPHVTLAAAASVAGIPVPEARDGLTEVCRAQLATEPVPGRFRLHPLVHRYAGELAGRVDGGAERQAARHRLIDHYRYSALRALRLLAPTRPLPVPAPPGPGVVLADLADARAALVWATTETPVLAALNGHHTLRPAADRLAVPSG